MTSSSELRASASLRFVVVACAACLAIACTRRKEPKRVKPKRPSVVVVTIDTLRADRLGCYGFEAARTPHIDALAAEGVRVTHAVAPTPITLPSHATIFTGLQPPAHGIRDNGRQRLPDEVDTLAERLRTAGYRTQAFVSAMVLHRRFNLDQGFEGYDDELRREGEPDMFMIQERSGEKTMNRALAWLDSVPPSSPYLLWVHLFDPHQPYAPPPADAEGAPTLYDGEITSADRQVGRLVEALRNKGTLDDTIFVLTSDHGESLGEHGEATHALFIYESTVHVPLLFRYPRKLPAGRTLEGTVRSVDIMPTVLGLLGLPVGTTQGKDLARMLAGSAELPTLNAYSESLHGKYEFAMAPLFAMRSGDWTYVRAPRPELYDRSADPGETNNLLEEIAPAKAASVERASKLDALVQGVHDDSKRFGLVAEAHPLDDETVKMLQALGYMDDSAAPEGLDGMDPKDGVKAFDAIDEARLLMFEGKYREAKKVLRSLLAWIPTNASARNLLALCEFRTDNARAAKALYLESLQYEPRQPEVLRQLSRIAIAEGDLEAGRARAAAALDVDPEDVEAMMLVAYVDLREGRIDEAKGWYEKAIETDPSYPEAYLQYGNLEFRLRSFDSARKLYEKALGADPDNANAAAQAGLSALQLGDLTAAARLLKTATRLDPDDWKSHFNLACVHARGGDTKAARRELAEAQADGLPDPRLITDSPCFRDTLPL